MTLPTATYRLQLREGVDFDAATRFLPHLVDLGVSHLYLSPIFTAVPGSTHGYDVTDPGEIDPEIGGRAGFDRLSDAAQAAGIGIIIDIVPNHMAFSLDNRWLAEVLRGGPDAPHAGHFDIHWDQGKLVLPWLTAPFDALLAEGKVKAEGDHLIIDDLALPLRDGPRDRDLSALHAAQHWRAVHWSRERDGVTHRRFFNVTGLIGMRVEDEAVFRSMHDLTVDLVRAGRVQGIRIDHIDGLADPAGYLDRLREAVGDTPIWVEKILTGDETLPAWPVQGTTGYEVATKIAQVLTDARGAERLKDAWLDQTDGAPTFHLALQEAKGHVIRRDLAAELHRLILLARRACDARAEADPGDEALREAVIALLTEFPRYRTYFAGDTAQPDDVVLMRTVASEAGATLRSPDVVELLSAMITAPRSQDDRAFRRRFQQVTGALLAKSHEDTAGFRWTPVLAACEVGADPDVMSVTAADLTAWAARQPGTGLILTSSHDTKRSEDARMRLAAWTRLPDEALDLIRAAGTLPGAQEIPGNVLWYLVQSVLAIWNPADPILSERLTDHMTKALREADEITSWTHPDAEAEEKVLNLTRALVDAWGRREPSALSRLIAQSEALSLCQLALKLTLPGIPDIYRGCEGVHLALTDPDNRRPVDLAALRSFGEASGLEGEKRRLLGRMLALRKEKPELFTHGTFSAEAVDEGLTLSRANGSEVVSLRLEPGAPLADVVTVLRTGQ